MQNMTTTLKFEALYIYIYIFIIQHKTGCKVFRNLNMFQDRKGQEGWAMTSAPLNTSGMNWYTDGIAKPFRSGSLPDLSNAPVHKSSRLCSIIYWKHSHTNRVCYGSKLGPICSFLFSPHTFNQEPGLSIWEQCLFIKRLHFLTFFFFFLLVCTFALHSDVRFSCL